MWNVDKATAVLIVVCLLLLFPSRSDGRKKRRLKKGGGWKKGVADVRDDKNNYGCPFERLDGRTMDKESLFDKCFLPQLPCIIHHGFNRQSHA